MKANAQHLQVANPFRTYCGYRRWYGTTLKAPAPDLNTARKKPVESLALIGRDRRIARMLRSHPYRQLLAPRASACRWTRSTGLTIRGLSNFRANKEGRAARANRGRKQPRLADPPHQIKKNSDGPLYNSGRHVRRAPIDDRATGPAPAVFSGLDTDAGQGRPSACYSLQSASLEVPLAYGFGCFLQKGLQ